MLRRCDAWKTPLLQTTSDRNALCPCRRLPHFIRKLFTKEFLGWGRGEETLFAGPSPAKPFNMPPPRIRVKAALPPDDGFCRFVNLRQSTANTQPYNPSATGSPYPALGALGGAEAATTAQKIARARLHLLFLLFRYGGCGLARPDI